MPDRPPGASCAGGRRPSPNSPNGPAGDRADEAQQRDEAISVRASKTLDQRCGETIMPGGRHERGTRDLPERRRREAVTPPSAPALDGATVDADHRRQARDPCRGRAMPEDGDQYDDGGEVDFATEKAQRRRCLACAAAIDGTAEAEALVVLGAELTAQALWAAPGLAPELGRMQCPPAVPASPGLRNPVQSGHRLRWKADTAMVIADSW